MSTLRINLFGRLAVFIDDRPVDVGSPQLKPNELLAYLLLYHQQSHPREVLAALLWPELAPPHAKKNLRKVLCSLQHRFAAAVGPDHPPLLRIEHDWLALNPDLTLQLDVAMFERAHILTRPQLGMVLDREAAQVAEGAVALYQGDLLTGLYSDWCLRERERLAIMHLELRQRLLTYAEHQHAYEQGIVHGREILRHDQANEQAHRSLMRLYYLSGDRSAALRQYGHCVVALAHELGVRPRKCTESLYQQICQDDLAPPAAGLSAEPQREPGDSHQLAHAALQHVLGQVRDELQRVEHLLDR